MSALHLVLCIQYYVLWKKIKKKFFLGFLCIILAALYIIQFPNPAFAQSPSYAPLPSQISTQSPIFTNLQLLNLMHGLSCILTGNSPTNQPCVEYTIVRDLQGKASTIPVLSSVNTQGGLLGAAGSILAGLYINPPLNTSQYLASVTDGFGLVSSAHAQAVPGSGNNVLSPVITLWQVSRNFAYLVLIIVFIIVGLMVMFRTKINPQTVITIQAALPGLVVGLILITFSYFAAALITDAAFIGTDIVGYYFNAAIDPNRGSLLQQLQTENLLTIGSSFAGRLGSSDIEKTANIIIESVEGKEQGPIFNPQNMVKMTIALFAYPIGEAIGKPLGEILVTVVPLGKLTKIDKLIEKIPSLKEKAGYAQAFGGVTAGLLLALYAFHNSGQVLGIALYLVALFAVLYAVFRLLLALINSYLSIIFLTITAPFHFLAASLPGRQGLTINWVRNMLADVLAFPAVIAVFYFAAYLLGENKIKAFVIGAPLQLASANGTLPLFGGLDMSFIRTLLAIGAILVTPKIPEVISQAIGKPSRAGGVFDQAISQAVGQGQRYVGQNQQAIGKFSGNVGQSWERWRGPDPYRSIADEVDFERWLQGKGPIPEGLGRKSPHREVRNQQRLQSHIESLQGDAKHKEMQRLMRDIRGGKDTGMSSTMYASWHKELENAGQAQAEEYMRGLEQEPEGAKETHERILEDAAKRRESEPATLLLPPHPSQSQPNN